MRDKVLVIKKRLEKFEKLDSLNPLEKNAYNILFNYYIWQLTRAPLGYILEDALLISRLKCAANNTLDISINYVSSLDFAIETEDSEFLEAILYFRSDLTSSALVKAVKQNKIALVQLILKHKNATSRVDLPYQDVMQTAIVNGNIEIVEALLNKGVEPTSTHFEIACAHGQIKIAQKIRRDNFSYNDALLYAADFGNLRGVKYLVEELEADVDYTAKTLGRSKLGLYTFLGYKEKIETELNQKTSNPGKGFNNTPHPDLNSFDDHGYTPLMLAVRNGDVGTIETLLNAGADIYLENSDSGTALLQAVDKGDEKIVSVLLDRYSKDLKNPQLDIPIAIEKAEASGFKKIEDDLLNFLKKKKELAELFSKLNEYKVNRASIIGEKGTKEYLHPTFFGFIKGSQKSYTEKKEAIHALKRVLRGEYADDAGNPIDLVKHLPTLRNGNLAKCYLRPFVKKGHAKILLGSKNNIDTITQFVKALQEKIDLETKIPSQNVGLIP